MRVQHRGRARGRYRGPDRRRVQPTGLPWAVPAAGVAIFVPVAVLATTPSELPADNLRAVLAGAAVVGGIALTVLAALSWRASGRAAPLWLSVAGMAYALWMIGPAQQREVMPWEGSPVLWLTAAAGLALWLVLIATALWPTVDARLRPWTMLTGGAAGVVALAVVLQVGTEVAVPADAGTDAPADTSLGVHTLLPAGWLAVAAVLAVQGHRRRDPVLAWATLLTLAVGGAEALSHLADTPQALLASDLAHTAAVLTVAGGLGANVAGLTSGHRREVGEAIETSKAVREQLRAADAARSELRHEAQNALTTVDAGVSTLHASHSQLSEEERAALSEAVRGTVERLRLLLDDPDEQPQLRPTRLAEVLTPSVAGARARGQTVHADVPPDLWVLAHGPTLGQIVDALLDNAAKHAAASTIELRAVIRQEGIVLRCEDDGPGVPAEERERIFQRGNRGQGAQGKGKGLGLTVAARLTHEQGGAMWVDEREGGGASFAIWLARAQPDRTDRPITTEDRRATPKGAR